MRVSDQRMFELSKKRLAGSREAFARAQERVSTGLRVVRPSDDPSASARAERLRADVERADAHARTAAAATSRLGAAESTLADAGDVLGRLREIAVMQANGTIGATERAAAAGEVRELRATLLGLANTESGGVHLFSGMREDAPPFDAAGTYLGDPIANSVEVAPGVRLDVGLPGDRVFGAAGGTDVFAAIDQLESALVANDPVAVSGTLDELDASLDQVTSARAELGSRMESARMAEATNVRRRDLAAAETSDLVEMDQATAYLEFVRAQQSMQEAIELAAKLGTDSSSLFR